MRFGAEPKIGSARLRRTLSQAVLPESQRFWSQAELRVNREQYAVESWDPKDARSRG